jgi:hypothetical protein
MLKFGLNELSHPARTMRQVVSRRNTDDGPSIDAKAFFLGTLFFRLCLDNFICRKRAVPRGSVINNWFWIGLAEHNTRSL